MSLYDDVRTSERTTVPVQNANASAAASDDADLAAAVAGWDSAPDLMEGALNLELTPEQCDLDYWIRHVAQGTLAGLVDGHRPHLVTPELMRADGPLRDALTEELAFRSIAEEKATRAIPNLVASAPDVLSMEFFATQMLDEARHARVFRNHLLDLDVPAADLAATIERVAGQDRDRVLVPLERFAEPVQQARDFAGGVVILTVLVEGVLAPAAELSERKWRPFDPAAADIERAAGIDEIRHLTVGSTLVRRHLIEHPEDKPRLLDLIRRGRELWAELPILDMLVRREELYQQGLEEHLELAVGHELAPGLPLADSTVTSRLELAARWAGEMQDSRLIYMGLGEALQG